MKEARRGSPMDTVRMVIGVIDPAGTIWVCIHIESMAGWSTTHRATTVSRGLRRRASSRYLA